MTEWQTIGQVLRDTTVGCPHEHAEVRKKRFSNGTEHLCTQCRDCGQRVGQGWHTQVGIDMATVRLFDEALSERGSRQQQSRALQNRREEKRSRHLEYEERLKGPEWASLRLKVLKRDNHWCQACLEEEATQVHHKTYDHIYHEIMWELVSVCRRCHERLHGIEETGRASTIRDVSGVSVLPEYKRGEWREAIGAAPGFLGTELPEDVVRRSRDG